MLRNGEVLGRKLTYLHLSTPTGTAPAVTLSPYCVSLTIQLDIY